MTEYLNIRCAATKGRLDALRARLGNAETIVKDRACVYATGSFGREEAGSHSDLDLFIVGQTDRSSEPRRRALSRLDEICVKAELIEVTRKLSIQDFSGDGEYLAHYTVDDLITTPGHPHDDASNTFTARLLLLLESQPLVGEEVYRGAVGDVVAAYWGDFANHKNDFIPAFLVNDVLRLWRTFCVNYEARTVKEPAHKKAKRKLKIYKLRHSRLLTCYSALAYLLALFAEHKTVTPDDACQIVSLTPTARLERLSAELHAEEGLVHEILATYETFLRNTDGSEKSLVERFMDKESSHRLVEEANTFGDLVSRLLEGIGKRTRLYRMLLV